jgi:hypothetical protein
MIVEVNGWKPMALTFQIRDGLIELTFRGDIMAKDIVQAVVLVRDAEAELDVSPDRISDLSDTNLGRLETEDVREFAHQRNTVPMKNKVKSAIIAPKPEQFGLARLFQAHNENPMVEVQVFRDATSAYDWLGRKAKK